MSGRRQERAPDPRESQVLSTLLHAGRRPVSKQELLHSVWGLDFDGEFNVVDVYIRYLRQKLGPDRIVTTPRVGFRLADDDQNHDQVE